MDEKKRKILKNRKKRKCPNCGGIGPHYVHVTDRSFYNPFWSTESGFWTCPKYYDKNGVRVRDESKTVHNFLADNKYLRMLADVLA